MTYQVTDPRTGTVDRSLAPPTTAELDELCAGLRRGQPAWQAAGPDRRIAALRQWGDFLASGRADLLGALAADTGRIREEQLEIDLVLGMIERWCRSAHDLLDEGPRALTSVPFVKVEHVAHPYALVGVISPWNFPLLLALIDAVPALLAGCAVLAKPSEVTPRFIAPLLGTVARVPLLRDVFTAVEGDGRTGAAIVDRVDAVCFTGSVTTGQTVAEAAARAFIPAFLELGGKDPAIVLAGADLDRASSALVWASTSGTGQSCLSIERIYVQAAVAEEFTRLLVEKAQRVGLGYPDPRHGLGPFIPPGQAQVVERQLADAVARGAVVRTGGRIERHGGGRWLRPTVVTRVDHSMLLMTEETFGPVLPVMAFGEADEAVRLANDSRYGLSAAVFARTEAEALAVARQLRAGAVSVNDAALTAIVQEAEKNSFGRSGLGGSRMGPPALRRFIRRQVLLVNTSASRDPWWYPNV